MASRTVYDCDRCGKRDLGPGPIHVEVSVERRIDPPSGRTEDVYRAVHLCGGCASGLLDAFINEVWQSEDRRRWAAGLKPAARS